MRTPRGDFERENSPRRGSRQALGVQGLGTLNPKGLGFRG